MTELKGNTLKRIFESKKPLTRTENTSQQLFIRAKFENIPSAVIQTTLGLFTCKDERCRLNNVNYTEPCSSLPI